MLIAQLVIITLIKALNMCDIIEEQRMGSNQVTLPFTPDGLDDQKAYDELQSG